MMRAGLAILIIAVIAVGCSRSTAPSVDPPETPGEPPSIAEARAMLAESGAPDYEPIIPDGDELGGFCKDYWWFRASGTIDEWLGEKTCAAPHPWTPMGLSDCTRITPQHIAQYESWLLATCGPHGDITGDGAVSTDDLLVILDSWGECDSIDDCPADLDRSGVVDVDDMLIVLNNWGTIE